ncbi:MAG TPA: porin [Rhizomicrobium sp.]
MNFRTILLGTAACALFVAPALAQDASSARPNHHHHVDSVASRLDRMEHLIEEQQAEIRQLKAERGMPPGSGGAVSAGATAAAVPTAQPEVTAAQFEALQNQVYEQSAATKNQAIVTLGAKTKGRPIISSADGKWTFFPRIDVMGDWAAYDPGKTGVATDSVLKQSGENFRRAQIGFQGTFAGDFAYKFLYDFGGTNGDETYQAYFNNGNTKISSTGAGSGPHIKEAWLAYKGILDPITFQVGALPTPANLSDMTASDDLLFNERPSPAQIDRGLAADDGRDSVGFWGNGDIWYASGFFTGDTVGKGDLIAPGSGQEAVVGRFALAPWYDPTTNFNVHLGVNATDVIHPQESTVWNGTTNVTGTFISLSDRPELRVDNVSFLNTGSIAAQSAFEWGVEGAASWGPLMVEGENFWYNIDRIPGSGKSNPNFGGWYVEGSWVLTGEPHKYSMATASYLRPSPADPFNPAQGDWGAFEVASRYSSTDLEYHAGQADAVYGGKQNIFSVGLNWYPIDPVKVMLDWEDINLTDIGGLTTQSTDKNGHFTDISTRVQVTF